MAVYLDILGSCKVLIANVILPQIPVHPTSWLKVPDEVSKKMGCAMPFK